MMKLACCVMFVALYLSFVSAVSFKGNVTVNGNADGWSFRKTKLQVQPFFIQYVSIDIEKQHPVKGKRNFNVSGIFGGASFRPGDAPYTFLASYDSGSDWTKNPSFGQWQSADVSDSLAYIASVYLRLEERNPNGTVVATQNLQNGHVVGNFSWNSDYSSITDTLSSASIVGTAVGASWSINITFIASSVVGVIDLANAVVGPSALEQIVQINNWPYQSAQNHLTLVMMTGTGSASASTDETITTITSGSDSSEVYFSASGSAVVNGQTQTVNVSTSTIAGVDVDARGNLNLIAQILGRYSSVTYNLVTVDFPAGAEAIQYDPANGVGDNSVAATQPSTSSASSVVASISMLVLLLVVLL